MPDLTINLTAPPVIRETITQTAHGFVVGNAVRADTSAANTYVLALADTEANSFAVGIVNQVVNANEFVITYQGRILSGIPAVAAGTIMYLSDVTPGALTITAPAIEVPILVVTQNALTGIVINSLQRGGGGGSVASVTGDSVDNSDPANPVVNAIPLAGTSAGPGNQVSGDVEMDETAGVRYYTSDGTDIASVMFLSGAIEIHVSNIATGLITKYTITKDSFIVESDTPNFPGAQYGANYSADYTNRSLVDKEYVDNSVGSPVVPIVYLTRVALQALISGSTLDTTVTYAITDAVGSTEVMFVWASGVNTLYTTGVAQTNSYFGIYNIGADTFIQGYIPAISSPAQGDVIYHNGTVWTRLAAGTAGQYLQTNGAGSNPTWDTPVAQDSFIVTANMNIVTIASGATIYFTVFGSNANNVITVEADRQTAANIDFTMSRFFVTTRTAQSGTGSMVLTFRKAGVSQTLVVTIAAASAAGVFSDTANSFAITSGDLLTLQVVNNASTASAQLVGWTALGTR